MRCIQGENLISVQQRAAAGWISHWAVDSARHDLSRTCADGRCDRPEVYRDETDTWDHNQSTSKKPTNNYCKKAGDDAVKVKSEEDEG